MIKKGLITIFMICLMGQSAYTQIVRDVSKVGTSAAAFLRIGVGARAMGMGGGFVAVSDDATALYWNIAGIAQLEKNQFILEHTEWLAGINFDFAGVVIHLGSFGTLGLSLTSLTSGDIAVRTVQEPEGTGEVFDVQDLAAGLSYARNLTNFFSIGFTAKFINQNIFNENAQGFALDIGTLFTTDFNGMRIGMSISNLGTTMELSGRDLFFFRDEFPDRFGDNDKVPAELRTDSFDLPLLFRIGVAMDILKGENRRWTIAVDGKHPNDNTESINFGSEYAFNNFIALRVGYKDLFLRDAEGGFSFGGGLKTRVSDVFLKLDYAYFDAGRLDNAQRFSLGFEF